MESSACESGANEDGAALRRDDRLHIVAIDRSGHLDLCRVIASRWADTHTPDARVTHVTQALSA